MRAIRPRLRADVDTSHEASQSRRDTLNRDLFNKQSRLRFINVARVQIEFDRFADILDRFSLRITFRNAARKCWDIDREPPLVRGFENDFQSHEWPQREWVSAR